MIVGQILLTVNTDGEDGYTIEAETTLKDNEAIKKVLREALELLGGEPSSSDVVEVYKATTPQDHKAGIYWPDPDARPTY